MNESRFNVDDGIYYQNKDLEKWKQVLKPKVHNELCEFAVKNNHLAKDGYEIVRGEDLNSFILNYSYNKKIK